MLQDNAKLFLKLYHRPLSAISGIIDEGSLLFAILAVVGVSFLVHAAIGTQVLSGIAAAAPAGAPPAYDARGILALASATSTLAIAFSLALLYVPATLFVASLLEPIGSFGVAFRRDYGSLLACTLMAWAAAFLPASLASFALTAAGAGPLASMALLGAGALYFLVLMVCVVRTVFGARLATSVGTVAVSWLSFGMNSFLPLLASPFLLYWGYQYFHGEIGDVTWSFGARQSFKRYLEVATINPRDASAHYHLGLIHQGRHQIPEAIARFTRAVEIDAGELDAHYQLGRIARLQKRYEDAIRHFEGVVARDERFARHEVWREIGATYLESGSLDHARWALEKYVGQRPHDPEGLYDLGETLERLGQADESRRQLAACIEAVDTSPPYVRREVRRWRKLAEQRLGKG